MTYQKHLLRIMHALGLALLLATGAQAAHHESGDDMADSKTIVDIAASNADFSTLVAAVKAADLVDVLAGEGPYTVFAPTNAAFAALPEGTVESLLKPENKDQLIAVLTYHVVPGKVMASDVVSLSSAETVQGGTVDIVAGDTVTVAGAQVVATDIVASNGVIHVIDAVMLPTS